MDKLIKLQNELKVPKGNINKFGNYKYRSAEDILENVKPLLLKHSLTLTLTDKIAIIGDKYFLNATATILDNDNKESITIDGYAELSEHKGMSSEQCTGTASSYARKYALNGLFLIDETEQDADSKDNNNQENQKKTLVFLDKDKNITEDWQKVTNAIKENKVDSIDMVKKKYNLSKDVENKLTELINNQNK